MMILQILPMSSTLPILHSLHKESFRGSHLLAGVTYFLDGVGAVGALGAS